MPIVAVATVITPKTAAKAKRIRKKAPTKISANIIPTIVTLFLPPYFFCEVFGINCDASSDGFPSLAAISSFYSIYTKEKPPRLMMIYPLILGGGCLLSRTTKKLTGIVYLFVIL